VLCRHSQCQFHQHITSSFCASRFTLILLVLGVKVELKFWLCLLEKISCNVVGKTDCAKRLVKLTHRINITKMFTSKGFMLADPKIVKIQSSCQYLFSTLGSALIKAACKMLMKLTPDDIING